MPADIGGLTRLYPPGSGCNSQWSIDCAVLSIGLGQLGADILQHKSHDPLLRCGIGHVSLRQYYKLRASVTGRLIRCADDDVLGKLRTKREARQCQARHGQQADEAVGSHGDFWYTINEMSAKGEGLVIEKQNPKVNPQASQTFCVHLPGSCAAPRYQPTGSSNAFSVDTSMRQ